MRNFKKIIPVLLLCFILLTNFYACKPDDNNNSNGGNPIEAVNKTAVFSISNPHFLLTDTLTQFDHWDKFEAICLRRHET